MSQSYAGTAPASKLERYEKPVLFSTSGGQIWHIPKIEKNGQARFACGHYRAESVRVTSLSAFERRRNHRLCKQCAEQTNCDGYPADGPIRVDSE